MRNCGDAGEPNKSKIKLWKWIDKAEYKFLKSTFCFIVALA